MTNTDVMPRIVKVGDINHRFYDTEAQRLHLTRQFLLALNLKECEVLIQEIGAYTAYLNVSDYDNKQGTAIIDLGVVFDSNNHLSYFTNRIKGRFFSTYNITSKVYRLDFEGVHEACEDLAMYGHGNCFHVHYQPFNRMPVTLEETLKLKTCALIIGLNSIQPHIAHLMKTIENPIGGHEAMLLKMDYIERARKIQQQGEPSLVPFEWNDDPFEDAT